MSTIDGRPLHEPFLDPEPQVAGQRTFADVARNTAAEPYDEELYRNCIAELRTKTEAVEFKLTRTQWELAEAKRTIRGLTRAVGTLNDIISDRVHNPRPVGGK